MTVWRTPPSLEVLIPHDQEIFSDDEQEETPPSCWMCCCWRRRRRGENKNRDTNDETLTETSPLVTASSTPKPYVKAFSDEKNNNTVVVMVLDVESRRFELVALHSVATVGQVLTLLPTTVQDKQLKACKFVALADCNTAPKDDGEAPVVEWNAERKLASAAVSLFYVALTAKASAKVAWQQAQKLLQDGNVRETVRVT